MYAIICLGFVVIYKATGVINFAQGGLLLVCVYVAYSAVNDWGIPFPLAVILAMATGAGLGLLIERLLLRRLLGQPMYAVVMVTLGILTVILALVPAIWGPDALSLGDPWGVRAVSAAGVTFELRKIWAIILTGCALAAFFAFFRFSKLGLAMRAAAIDQEAAVVQGISARRVVATSWAISGAVAALGGIAAGSGPAQVQPGLDTLALVAIPAMIVGGLDSAGGAVVGGLLVGVSQALTAGYQPQYAPILGTGFSVVAPYVLLILVMLVRPYGIFGTKEVRRA